MSGKLFYSHWTKMVSERFFKLDPLADYLYPPLLNLWHHLWLKTIACFGWGFYLSNLSALLEKSGNLMCSAKSSPCGICCVIYCN